MVRCCIGSQGRLTLRMVHRYLKSTDSFIALYLKYFKSKNIYLVSIYTIAVMF